MNIIYTNYDALFERWAIMSFQEDVTEQEILDYLQPRTTENLFNKLLKEIKSVRN